MTGGFLSLGDNYKVPLELFRINRDKLRDKLFFAKTPTKTNPATTPSSSSVVVLHGGTTPTRYDTDHEPIFRQESYFWYLTGVKEADCALLLTPTQYILCIPHYLPEEGYATIMGRIKSCEEFKLQYGADQVIYTHQLEETLQHYLLLPGPPSPIPPPLSEAKIYVMKGLNTDSGNNYNMAPTFSFPTVALSSQQALPQPYLLKDNEQDDQQQQQQHQQQTIILDDTTLFPLLAECRVTKSPLELQLLEHVTQVTSMAHVYVMRNIQPTMWEYQAESLFRHYTYYNYGSRLQSYTSICGCGPNSAVLHYGHAGEPNARQLLPTDHCLFDMGAEYQCYASDVTCSFPANGTFSERYQPIYQAVLDAQTTVYAMLRPGVSWVDCHKAAEASILQSLIHIGLVEPGEKTIHELVEMRLGAVFMPHGLGHFIGIDTHDVGGYLPHCPPRIQQPGLSRLRTARILEANMVLTVEPGCYFIDHLLDEALNSPTLSPHLHADRLSDYRGYGGVRLEDVVWISPPDEENGRPNGGCVNFTICPRTVKEVEFVMNGGMWPPPVDEAPELRRIHLTTSMSLLGPPPSK